MADSIKELRARVKELRAKNCGAVVSKATIDQLREEIAHHESALRQREQAQKRKAALEKAREVKASKKKPEEEEEKKPKTPREKKAEVSGRAAKDELSGKSAKRPVKKAPVEEEVEEKPKVRKVKAVVEESSEPVLAKNMRRKVVKKDEAPSDSE